MQIIFSVKITYGKLNTNSRQRIFKYSNFPLHFVLVLVNLTFQKMYFLYKMSSLFSHLCYKMA